MSKVKLQLTKHFLRKTNKANVDYKFTIDIDIPEVDVISSDGSKSNRFQKKGKQQPTKYGKNKPLEIVTIPLLYHAYESLQSSVFKFGKDIGENDYNGAEVSVTSVSNGDSVSESDNAGNKMQLNFDTSEFYNYPGNGSVDGKKFLCVTASDTKKVELSISKQAERGKVYVCVFNKNGKLVKMLNPKSQKNSDSELKYIVDDTVYVVPVISPTEKDGIKTVFEVGDPRQVAMVEIEEE